MPRLTEYDVRPLDENGEAVDVDSYVTIAEAIRYAEHLAPKYPAVIVERHRMLMNADRDRIDADDYEVVWYTGDDAVLRLWNG